MITGKDCLAKYGDPNTPKAKEHLAIYVVPEMLRKGAIPSKIYCNKDMMQPLEKALQQIANQGLGSEIKTWDGSFCIREIRGVKGQWSLHSWGVALDINAQENGLGREPKLSAKLVKCFTDSGFVWGGTFRRKDGMHFELAKI